MHLEKLDSRDPATPTESMLCFTGTRNEIKRLPHFLDYYRDLGIDRFFFIDNGSDDGTTEYLLDEQDCHCFHAEGSHFELNIWPPRWNNTLLNVFGEARWCAVVDSDELLVYPDCETVPLSRFCRFLDETHTNAIAAYMIDMYGYGPIADESYKQGAPFTKAAPYFDPEPGWLRPHNGCPPMQMFGGVRERVFWQGRFKQTLPPCISKIPLVKWKRGMHYTVAQHVISMADLNPITGALLHFKFLTGFKDKTVEQVDENKNLKEKTLEERQAYLEALQRDPHLTLYNKDSVAYRDTRQLIELGWISSTPEYERFLNSG